MKVTTNFILTLLVAVLFWQTGNGQITAGSETIVYTSPNPATDPGVTINNMVKLRVGHAINLNRNRINGILADADGGRVSLNVFYYDASAPQGKAALLYSVYTEQNSPDFKNFHYGYTASNYSWNIPPAPFYLFGDELSWESNDISGSALHVAQLTSSGNPSANRASSRILRVIVEISVTNATFYKFRVPGIGEFDPYDFFQLPTQIKGSSYETVTLTNNLTFGHQSNQYEITVLSSTYVNYKMLGFYDQSTTDEGYVKATFRGNHDVYLAIPFDRNISHYPEFQAYDNGLVQAAFVLENDNASYTRQFDFIRLDKTDIAGETIKFPVDPLYGPFLVAKDFEVSFQEDLALPIEKRKLYHRADWPNDVLVCAHRGTWNKVGSKNPPDYSGIAENTTSAYDLAINNPDIDWIEFDARRTHDGVFIAFHDESLHRVTNFADDADCFSLEDVNLRNKLWRKAPEQAATNWVFEKGRINDLNWEVVSGQIGDESKPAIQALKASGSPAFNGVKNLVLRDYLGCKVKDDQGDYLHPLKLEDAFEWLAQQKAQGKHTIISVDYKDGVKHLDELYKMILEYDLEGQILLSVYAKDFALEDYQAEYGTDFLKQIPLKPTFYEPVSGAPPANNYGGDLAARIDNYVNAADHFLVGITMNINHDGDAALINYVRQPEFTDITDRMWVLTHYQVPFMSSVVDNNDIVSPEDCDPSLHPAWETCPNLFWRADFDWLLNNGTNAIFSDDPDSLIEYLKAKGIR